MNLPAQPPIRLALGIVNAYLLQGRDGDVLVDTGLPGYSGWLLHLLRRSGSSPDRLVLIILTHGHPDHIGNLHRLRALTSAPVLAHAQELASLQSRRYVLPKGQNVLAQILMGSGRLATRYLSFPPISPEVVATGDRSLADFGIAGRVIYTPGHTVGSVSVVLDDGHALVGDVCQNGWAYGMGMRRPHVPLADHPDLIGASWRKLIAEGAQWLHPGHGRALHVSTLKEALTRLR